MKFMFLFACAMCAVAFSLLSIIYTTGEIPFHDAPPPVQDAAEADDDLKTGDARVLPGQEPLDQLRADLRQTRDNFLQKQSELDARTEEIQQQQALIADLKREMETLRGQLEQKVVSLETDEQSNLKSLADVYARMEPASASTLLMEMKPDRSARILRLIGDRQAAAILNETIGQGDRGTKIASEWSDIIRRMKSSDDR